MANIFLSADGDDGNRGTEDAHIRSIKRLWELYRDGDNVFFRRGDRFEGYGMVAKSHSSVQSFGDPAAAKPKITGAQRQDGGCGIAIRSGTRDLIVRDVEFHRCYSGGAMAEGFTNVTFDGVDMIECGHGTAVYGPNVSGGGNFRNGSGLKFLNIKALDAPDKSGDMFWVGKVSGLLFDNVVIRNPGHNYGDGIQMSACTNPEVRNTRISGVQGGKGCIIFEAVWDGGVGGLVENCYLEGGNFGVAAAQPGVVVRKTTIKDVRGADWAAGLWLSRATDEKVMHGLFFEDVEIINCPHAIGGWTYGHEPERQAIFNRLHFQNCQQIVNFSTILVRGSLKNSTKRNSGGLAAAGRDRNAFKYEDPMDADKPEGVGFNAAVTADPPAPSEPLSPDGTKGERVVTRHGVWTIADGNAMVNGQRAGNGRSTEYKVVGGELWTHGTDTTWYRWANGAWTDRQAHEPGTPAPEPEPGTVPVIDKAAVSGALARIDQNLAIAQKAMVEAQGFRNTLATLLARLP